MDRGISVTVILITLNITTFPTAASYHISLLSPPSLQSRPCDKMKWIVGLALTVWFLVIQVNGGDLLNITSLPQSKQDYDIKDNFCRLWAHTSEAIYPRILYFPFQRES